VILVIFLKCFFAIDRDGLVDIVFAINNKIYFLKNRLTPPTTSSYCVKSALPSDNQIFSMAEAQILALDPALELYGDEFIPKTIRIGDFAMDGYPDLLITLKNLTNEITQSYIVHNQEGILQGLETAIEVGDENAVLAAFFDLDEDG
jgi:hypothetical protein